MNRPIPAGTDSGAAPSSAPFDGTVAVEDTIWRQALPPAPSPERVHAVRRLLSELLAADERKVVVLDDDPTGSQTVHGVDVLTGWTVADLEGALRVPERLVFVLTNSRSLPADKTAALHGSLAAALAEASRRSGAGFTLVSRSDSTLRGHYPAETDALTRSLEAAGHRVDAVVLAPFFEEGGRLTAWDVHWVHQEGRMVPAGLTEYARDHAFGYRASRLSAWVQEKTAGRIPAERVLPLGLEELRTEEPGALARRLGAYDGPVVAVHAVSYEDMEAAVAALLLAERAGRRYLFRTAASFVRVRGGIAPRPLLAPEEMAAPAGGGLVVAGSYVERTSRQLAALLSLPRLAAVELDVRSVLAGGDRRRAAVDLAVAACEEALLDGRHAVVFTSRTLHTEPGEAGLTVGAQVAQALVDIVGGIGTRPAFVVAKGGITSSRVAVEALGMRRARVLGQALPGVPVWRLGPESRFPGLCYVVFPGNVGGDRALVEILGRLSCGAR